MHHPYERPEIKDLGSLSELTLTVKGAGADDGTEFDPTTIGLPGPPIPIGVNS